MYPPHGSKARKRKAIHIHTNDDSTYTETMLEILVVSGEKNKVKKREDQNVKVNYLYTEYCCQIQKGGKENFIPVKRTKFFFKCFFKKDLTYVQGYIKKNCISSTLLMTN